MRNDLNEREKRIIDLARGMLNRLDEFSEASIDANFIFRFEPVFNRWVNQIRSQMRVLVGLSGNEPLSSTYGARFMVHIDSNAGLSLQLVINNGETSYVVSTKSDGYHCLDESLRAEIEHETEKALKAGKTEDLKRLDKLIWYEANQTHKIIAEIERLAHAYSLIPSKTERDEYSLTQRRQTYQSVLNWIIWGRTVPEFIWEKTGFLESKTNNGIERTIRFHRISEGKWQPMEDGGRKWVENAPPPNRRMRKDTRIRTWAIYFLSKRGGGRLTEREAIEVWDSHFPELSLSKKTYQADRLRILNNYSKKTFT